MPSYNLNIKLYILITLFLLIVRIEPIHAYDDVFDFGSAILNTELKHSITVQNKHETDLVIAEAVSSCKCLKILSYPEKIEPVKSLELEFSLIPNKTGSVEYEIALKPKNPAMPALTYLVMGNVEKEKITAEEARKFMIMPDQARDVQKIGKNAVLVDIRDKNSFNKCRIAGSINVPLFAIKTKNFLKDKELILYNDGSQHSAIIKQCKKLETLGFNAKTLNGGLYLWLINKYPSEGDKSIKKELNRISPQTFFSEKDYGKWLIINVSKSKGVESKTAIPEAHSIPFGKNSKRFIRDLKALINNNKNEPILSVLIANDNGHGYKTIEDKINRSIRSKDFPGFLNIFYLKNGFAGYNNFIEKQAALLQPKTKRTTKTHSTGSKVDGKPCATCP